MNSEIISANAATLWPRAARQSSVLVLRPRQSPDALLALRDLAAGIGLVSLERQYARQIETRNRMRVSIIARTISQDQRLSGAQISLEVDDHSLRCVATLAECQRDVLEELLARCPWSGHIQIDILAPSGSGS